MINEKDLPNEFKIFDVKNALLEYEYTRLIQFYDETHIEYLTDFHGFDMEYIIKRVEDITMDLTGIELAHQEPIYISKSLENEPNRIDAWSTNAPETKQFGNRLFTLLICLSEGVVKFPYLNLEHIIKPGDGLIWNNVVNNERVLNSVSNISPNTYYIKKWIREKEFI
jgi:hypothetical protein